VDARAIPQGWDRATVIGRSAVMVFDSSSVSYVGDQASYGPYRAPRSPQMRVAWHDDSQPGGVRFAPMPTSESGDDVQWRIPDPTWIRVVAVDGSPVLTAPCGLDESSRWWQCVSSWSEESGWSPPRAIRQGVVPAWPISSGSDPVLIASMTDASVRLVTRDVAAPVVELLGPSEAVPSGTAASGSVSAGDLIDGGQLACTVEVDGTAVATSSIPLFDDNAAYPKPVPGPLTLEWTSPILEPGTHEVTAWCADRAGNRSVDAVVEFEALLLPPLAPAEAAVTASDAAARLTWASPELVEGHAVVNGYRVELRQAGQSEIERTVFTGPDELLLDLSDLTNGVDYQVRVVASSEVGDSDATPWLSTTPLGPPAAPRAVVVKARPAGANVAWQAPSSDPARRKVGAYVVHVKDPVTGRITTGCTTTATSCTVTGLVNGRTVAVRVGSSPSSFSAWVNVRPIGVPAAPKIANVVWRTNGRAQVYWKPSTTGPAPVQGYRILVNGRLKGIAWSGKASSYLLTGQRQGVKYVFTVQAFNPMGRAATSSAPRIRPIP
jgi:hypothetical protein